MSRQQRDRLEVAALVLFGAAFLWATVTGWLV